MHPNPTHLLDPPYYHSPLQHPLNITQKSVKNQNKTHKKPTSFLLFQHLFIPPSGIRCGSVSHSASNCPISSNYKMVIAMSY